MLIVPAIIALYFYSSKGSAPVTTGWQVAVATLSGEGFATLILYAGNQAIFGSQKLGMRIYLAAMSIIFCAFFMVMMAYH
jgi:hypothetical protein